jgi:hypothetical protein
MTTRPFPNDERSAAAQAARLLFVNPPTGSDQDPDEGAPIAGITVRIPATYIARLQVLAEYGKVSRNTMAQLVMKAGFESIFELLPPEMVEELHAAILAEYQSRN